MNITEFAALNATGMTKAELIKIKAQAVAAVDSLEIGQEFRGAYGDAKKAGYTIGNMDASMFVGFYMQKLESVTLLLELHTNKITKITRA
jgi:hypothetical protein